MCETRCARLAGNAGPKSRKKVAIWALSHNFGGRYLRNYKARVDSQTKTC